jgi:hypothetical protein
MTEADNDRKAIALKNDLTNTVGGYTDRHMNLMMLEAHSSGAIDIYERNSLLRAKIDMLKKTKMIDYLERNFKYYRNYLVFLELDENIKI